MMVPFRCRSVYGKCVSTMCAILLCGGAGRRFNRMSGSCTPKCIQNERDITSYEPPKSLLVLSEEFVRAIKAEEIALGGMKAVEIQGNELVVCNCGGIYYAISRRCGHMNAPLELGTPDGTYLTCPMHCAQFDVSNGEALSR